jgi:hypothetical protein
MKRTVISYIIPELLGPGVEFCTGRIPSIEVDTISVLHSNGHRRMYLSLVALFRPAPFDCFSCG